MCFEAGLSLISASAFLTCFVIAMCFGFVSFVCGAMAGFEQGQFSVVSGQVTCIMPPGEFICEENKHESN